MAAIISSLNGDFIGTVKGYENKINPIINEEEINLANRTLEVYIPKLMPDINENEQLTRKVLVNNGNPNIKIKCSKYLTLATTISVPAKKVDEGLPKIGSLVQCEFLDGDWNLLFWKKFDPLGSWEVIDREKYPEVIKAELNGFNNSDVKYNFQINKEDKITINSDDFAIISYNNSVKDRVIKVNINERFKDSIVSEVEDIYGRQERITAVDSNNNPVIENSTGIYALIESLTNEIEALKERITELENNETGDQE